jgi:hypothetical protein
MTDFFPGIPTTADELWIGLFVFACFILLLTLRIPFKFKKETTSKLGKRLSAISLISLATTIGLILFALNSNSNRNLFLKLTLVQGLAGIVTFIIGLLMLKK